LRSLEVIKCAGEPKPPAAPTLATYTTGMETPAYDPRYLAGVLFFNRQDFFEAHEAWESIWLAEAGPEKKFYQALIQAAVALYHFGNGNVRGARKLYHSSRNYMEAYGSPYLGLDTASFWRQMERCFAALLASEEPDRSIELDEELIPTIALDPEPEAWPRAEDYVEEDDNDHVE
jgi:predicted metal-dependent hydrolase